jgi:hypothetical protein
MWRLAPVGFAPKKPTSIDGFESLRLKSRPKAALEPSHRVAGHAILNEVERAATRSNFF